MEKLIMEDGTEVIKLSDHNSKMADIRKNATKGYVHTGNEDYQKDMAELSQYRSAKESADLKANYLGEAGFRIKPEYHDDVLKLTGISSKMDEKEIKKTLTDFTSAEKNAHYLNIEGNQNPIVQGGNPTAPAKKLSGGGGFWRKNK